MARLLRVIHVKVEDRQFEQHKKSLWDYLGRSKRDFKGAGKAADDFGRDGARATRRVGDEAKRTATNVGLLGSSFNKLKAVVIGFIATRLTAGLVENARQVFDLGTAVEETASKFNTVFGPAAAEMNAYLDENANRMGRTVTEGREVTATVAGIAQGMGYTQEASAGFSREFVELAADLASFNNSSPEESFERLRAAIVGEYEPLRRYGIVLTEASVKQRALAESGKANEAALTQQELAAARLTLAYEKAGVAVGDLSRTQHQDANQAKATAAAYRQQAEVLSQALLPTLGYVLDTMGMLIQGNDLARSSFVRFAAEGVFEAVSGLVEFALALAEAGKGLVSLAGALGAASDDGQTFERFVDRQIGSWRIWGSLLNQGAIALQEVRASFLDMVSAARGFAGLEDLSVDAEKAASAARARAAALREEASELERNRRLRDKAREERRAELEEFLAGLSDAAGATEEQRARLQGLLDQALATAEALKKIPRALGEGSAMRQMAGDLDAAWKDIFDSIDFATIGDEAFGEVHAAIGAVNTAASAYADTLASINVRQEAGALTTAEAEAARAQALQAHRAGLQAVFDQYGHLIDIVPGLRDALAEAYGQAGKLPDTLSDAGDRLRDLAAGARGVLRLAGAFGTLSDEAERALSSIADIAEGVATGGVGGTIQALGGAVGLLQGILSGGRDEGRIRALARALDEQVHALRENTRALSRAAQIGADLTRAQIAAAQAAIGRVGTGSATRADLRALDAVGLSGVEDMFRDIFNLIKEESGVLDAAKMRDRIYEALVTGDFSRLPDYVREMVAGFDGLEAAMDDLAENLGAYSDTVAGVIEKSRDEQAFTGLEGAEAFRQFMLDAAGLKDLSAAARALFDEAAALDISTAAGQARFNEIVEQLYRMGLAGLAGQGISQDDLERLLGHGQGFVGGTGATSKSFRSVNTVTEASANELIAIDREQLHVLRSILSTLRGSPAKAFADTIPMPRLPQPGDFASRPSFAEGFRRSAHSSASHTAGAGGGRLFGDIHINGLGVYSIDQLVREFERHLRTNPRIR